MTFVKKCLLINQEMELISVVVKLIIIGATEDI